MVHTTYRGVDKSCPRNIVEVPVPVPCTKEQLKMTFWRYDTNRDRKLSRKELKEAFDYLGAYIPGWRAFRALNHADGNGDGYITEEEVDELINYAVKLGYLKS
ncbi:hypothetical protein LWI29_012098 [Acer saccharum]|uniref:EF-hand domain-containing protein n=1 Tax=Acer saccharum TaxID=4024 RepID=A0AA39RLR7_ACESA|nr:hypothetical protein LWI29_012098 [Acer saccharum]KAK1553774.1 hypothetical protein Q3G72_003533 [Acer saccharum]